jgi:hypothetical protein
VVTPLYTMFASMGGSLTELIGSIPMCSVHITAI